MKIDEIMTLIQAVSDSTLTSFELVEGDTRICLKREKEKSKIVTVAAPAVDQAVTAQMVSAAAGMAGAAPVPAAAQAPAPAGGGCPLPAYAPGTLPGRGEAGGQPDPNGVRFLPPNGSGRFFRWGSGLSPPHRPL